MSKSCSKCIYYVKGIIESECLKFGKPVIDETGINFLCPKKCRRDVLKCGMVGRYYREVDVIKKTRVYLIK